MSRVPRLWLVALACWCAAATIDARAADRPAAAVATASGPALVVGRVTTNPRKDLQRHQQFADYLAARTADLGIAAGRVRFAADVAEMAALLRAGEIDLLSESVFAALALAEQAGAELALREWRNGLASNHAILFTRSDSPIASLSDLAGRLIAFEDPDSATSYVLPRAALEEAGHRLVELPPRSPARPTGGAVGYVFVQEEINVTSWVHKGRADAGALGNQDWDDPERMPPALRDELRVFHRTAAVPRALLLLRRDLPAALKRRVKEILTVAHEEEEGRRVLDAYRQVTRFDAVTEEVAAEIAAARAAGARLEGAPR